MAKDSPRVLEKAFVAAISALRTSRTPYMVIGAFALSAWGRPRATLDVDFMILADQISDDLATTLSSAGFRVDEKWGEYNPMARSSQRRFRFGTIAIDILSVRDSHDRQAFRNRRRKVFRGHYVWFPSPEDLILQKLKIGRPQDFSDAAGIVERVGNRLDKRRLQRWAAKLRLMPELHHVLQSFR